MRLEDGLVPKVLQHKHEFDPSIHTEELGAAAHTCNLSVGRARTGRWQELPDQLA